MAETIDFRPEELKIKRKYDEAVGQLNKIKLAHCKRLVGVPVVIHRSDALRNPKKVEGVIADIEELPNVSWVYIRVEGEDSLRKISMLDLHEIEIPDS